MTSFDERNDAFCKALVDAHLAFIAFDGCDVYKQRLADEIADVIQAACNLADRHGIDLQAAMERCEERNRKRGRYGGEQAVR